jgi:hypothetical protein
MKQFVFQIVKPKTTVIENETKKNEAEVILINKTNITSVKPIKVVDNIYYFN